MVGSAVLSLSDAKAQVRVDGSDDDDLLAALIAAAVDHVERFTGLTLEPREVVEAAAGFGARLSTWPVRAVTGVAYRDGAGAEQQVVDGGWWTNLAARPLRLNPAGGGWPGLGGGTAPVTVTMQAGYEAGAVPAGIIQAIKLLVGHFYRNREAAAPGGVSEMPMAVDMLLRPHRLELV